MHKFVVECKILHKSLEQTARYRIVAMRKRVIWSFLTGARAGVDDGEYIRNTLNALKART